MSRELMRDFFERDLSVDEMSQVAKTLENDDDDAAFFAVLAAAHYRALGLPKLGGGRGFGPWSLTGIGLVVGAVLASVYWLARPVPPSVPLTPAPTIRALPAALPLVKPKQGAFAEGEALAVEVDLPGARTLRVDVLDSQGRRIKRLAEGSFEVGEHRFEWDGLDAQGQSVAGGKYRIVVDYGGGQMEKKVSIMEKK